MNKKLDKNKKIVYTIKATFFLWGRNGFDGGSEV